MLSILVRTGLLGNLSEAESVNPDGYFVRQQNGTVYVRNNRSLVLRITTENGVEGWGETYGLVAPKAPASYYRPTNRICNQEGSFLCASYTRPSL